MLLSSQKKKKEKLCDYSDRTLNNKEKIHHFMDRKNSSIGNEHLAKDSSPFLALTNQISIETIKAIHVVSKDTV